MAVTEIGGKTFLITGGASGLGLLYAENFLKGGAKNVALLDIQEAIGKETTNRLNKSFPGKVLFFKCDVGSEDSLAAAFNQVVKSFKQVDVIINNAGIMSDAPQVWRKASDVNWQGLVSLTMKGLQHMRKDQGGAGGTIINISSVAALFKFRHLPIYAGSKMAVLHFSQSLAEPPFYEKTEVRILTLCPGPTDTPLLQGLEERAYEKSIGEELAAENSQTIFQKPESCAAACLKMFKEGVNGSTWLANADKPGQDISSTIDDAWKAFFAVMYET